MKLYLGMVKNRPTLTNNYVKLRYMLETSKILNTSNTAFLLSPPPQAPRGGVWGTRPLPPQPPEGVGGGRGPAGRGGGVNDERKCGGSLTTPSESPLAGTHGDFYSNKVKDISMSDQQEAKGKIAALPTPPPQPPIMK
jgi:hypothetical protein